MIPPLHTLNHLFTDEASCIQFLRERGVFYELESCSICDGLVTFSDNAYRCRRKNCRKKVSLFQNSFFSMRKLGCNKVLFVGYLWLAGCNASSIMAITGHGKEALASIVSDFRQLVGAALDADDTIIGGPGIIVEIDESKFGKRKYNRGHRVEGVWVIGGVERTENRQMFAVVVERRDAATLLDVISRHVAAGSIVHTDLWRGYEQLEAHLDVEHRTVNHTQHFVNPGDGTHTNTIEGTWNGLKLKIAPRHRTRGQMTEHLLEFIWRRRHANDLWGGLIAALSDVHYE
jgi:transposase-like protein